MGLKKEQKIIDENDERRRGGSFSFDPFAPTSFSFGVGSYRGESALALGLTHYFNRDAMFSIGTTVDDDETMWNASLAFRIGRMGDKAVSNETERQMMIESKMRAKQLAAKVAYLEDSRAEDARTISDMKSEIEELKAMLVSVTEK